MAHSPGLALHTGAGLRPELRQSLRAGLQQGMAMLALPSVELLAELTRQAEENPFLVVEAPAPRHEVADPAAAYQIAAPVSLADHLHAQIVCMDLAPRIRALALYLASDLDPRGFLPTPDDEIAAELDVAEGEVANARAALQACDPTGIGARDLSDCIVLQLIEAGVRRDHAAAAMTHLAHFAEGRLRNVAAALKIPLADAEALADRIRLCTPDPAARFETPQVRTLSPELVIDRYGDSDLRVRLIDDPLRAISVDERMISQARSAADTAGHGFARDQQAAARRLVTSVGFRSKTLLRVGQALTRAQSAYFLGQARAPVPLSRVTIAEQLGLHPATVGRAVKGRGLLFAGKVHPMAWFFPTGLKAAETTLSQPEIMARMRDILAQETAGTVMNDDGIARRLKEDGVDIARRTVAKYRRCLRIPSAPRRRRLLTQQANGGGASRTP